MDEYRVQLPEYHGPLDLLLYLVKKNEVDVREIPIGVIADQFQNYLDILRIIDVEMVGDFLVAAATLAEIKSRMILPHSEEGPTDEAVDPRRELVQQLLEYRRFKEAAAQLEAQAVQRERRLPRGDDPSIAANPDHPPIRPVELWDLVSAFARIIQEAEALAPEQILTDETPQQVYQELTLNRVRDAGRLDFRDLFDPPYQRLRLIGLFLALLELIRSGDLRLEQDDQAGPIWLCPGLKSHGVSDVPKD